MGFCRLCHSESELISEKLGLCLDCIREKPDDALSRASQVHAQSRAQFGLPAYPPGDKGGILCPLCVNECRIPQGEFGYCGLRSNQNGRLIGVTSGAGKLSWYHDPLPTNCVADWICPAGTECGYPAYSYSEGPEYGYRNLAVFFHACSFNCLFCQNWQFKNRTFDDEMVSKETFVENIQQKDACICYFGGDPTPQLDFSLNVSKLAVEKNGGRILRICWETNGSMSWKNLHKMMNMALETGGCVKFDLKAWNDSLHRVLTGSTNQQTLENFKVAAEYVKQRPDPPLLLANTTMVPGYIDEEEILHLSKFLASLNPSIPYSLLVFHPQFYMANLPITPRETVNRCLEIARNQGLQNIRLGNRHLLES